MSPRVSLVEDHPVLRDVLQEHIGRLPGVELCVVSANAEEALDEFEGSMPDLIRELRLRQPGLRRAILSGHRSPAYVRQALEVGAHGYLLTGDPMEIERGLQAILAGKRYVSPDLRDA